MPGVAGQFQGSPLMGGITYDPNTGQNVDTTAQSEREMGNQFLYNVQGVNQNDAQAQYRNAQASRDQQQGALALMQQQAMGQGPAVAAAQGQFNQNLNQAMMAQAGAANSTRGGGANLAAAQQAGAQQQAAMAGQGAQQAATMRAQMAQQGAQGYLSGTEAMRQQDLTAQNQAFGQQLGLAQYQQGAMNQNMQNDLSWNAQANQREEAQLAADTSAWNTTETNRSNIMNNVVGGIFNAAGSMGGAMSDASAKENIRDDEADGGGGGSILQSLDQMAYDNSPAKPEAGKYSQMSDERLKARERGGESVTDSFLAGLHPKTFDYRESVDAPGPGRRGYLGVLAQDVERAPGGEELVTETPRGKALNPATMGAALAGLGRLHERVKALEEAAKGLRRTRGGKDGDDA